MHGTSQRFVLLIAAARLAVGGSRLRALARGEDRPLLEWLAGDAAPRVAQARAHGRRTLAQLATFNGRIVAIGDPEYPSGLNDLRDAPPFLFVRGALARGGVAVVGSRTPPPQALSFAYEFARRIREPIVSGLALGIDGAAHRGALAAGVPTVAYVGFGFGATYPREHASLEENIASGGGGIATERLPGESVTRWSLVKRDRLQAAHARALVLVASEADGGAMQALRVAQTLRRPAFTLAPPRLDSQGAGAWGGNVRALAEGAIALPFDVEEALRILHANAKHHD
ncbi:MAG TPA: DNA-processing protein DprA [Candidatus Baltobacteraceae bacterium]|jgi:DNA processing protein|nr:DNA-processing protein DprA [Candidatus Baltobacteraceae bacterium]